MCPLDRIPWGMDHDRRGISLPVRLVSATALAIIGVVVLLQAGSLASVCPAVYPAPPGCGAETRAVWSAAGLAVVAASYVAIVVVAGMVHTGRVSPDGALTIVMRAAGVVLGGGAIVFSAAAVLSGGFGIGIAGIALAICGLVAVIVLTVLLARPVGRAHPSRWTDSDPALVPASEGKGSGGPA